MSTWSDDLGRELRESPLPAHRPDHFERIRERVREVSARSGGGRPAVPATPRPTARRVAAPQRRPGTRPHLRMRLAAAAAVAAALVAAVAVSWTGVPGLEHSAPAPATADTVLAKVQHALTSLTSISGDVVEYGTARGRPFERSVGAFTFTSRGDYRIVQPAANVAYTYDAEARTAHRYVYRDGEILYSEVARDLPDPGPFFGPWMGVQQVLDRSVAAYAGAVIAELDPNVPVRPVTQEGRTAWSITVPERLSGGGGDGSVRIVVDAESGYPLAVEHWTADGDVSGTRIERIQVGGEIPRSEFTLPSEGEEKLLPVSERFRRMSLREAAHLGRGATASMPSGQHRTTSGARDFTPYATSWLPEGYKLSGVTGAVNASFMGISVPVKRGEVDSLTVVLTYQRGFDRFCIVSRWRRDNPPGSDDPFDENSAALTESTRVPVEYGSLRGHTADVVLGLPDWPHLYVSSGRSDQMTVSVAGDLTRAELMHIANSLRPIEE